MKKRKSILTVFMAAGLFLTAGSAKALSQSPGYKYMPGGGIFNGVTIPLDTAKATNFAPGENIGSSPKGIKSGVATRTNYMWLVELGDASINKAAKNGNIEKIHYVDYAREKVYVPLGFIPIYFDRYVTTVYGE